MTTHTTYSGDHLNAGNLFTRVELDTAEELAAGNPYELTQKYRSPINNIPWIKVLGGCCGSDLRHVTANCCCSKEYLGALQLLFDELQRSKLRTSNG